MYSSSCIAGFGEKLMFQLTHQTGPLRITGPVHCSQPPCRGNSEHKCGLSRVICRPSHIVSFIGKRLVAMVLNTNVATLIYSATKNIRMCWVLVSCVCRFRGRTWSSLRCRRRLGCVMLGKKGHMAIPCEPSGRPTLNASCLVLSLSSSCFTCYHGLPMNNPDRIPQQEHCCQH